MVVNAQAAAFVPAARPQVVVAADGTLAAIHEPSRVVVLEVPTCSPFAELGIDADAAASDVAWVGTPPRLLVLSRHSAHSMVYLVDPFGPRTIAEMRLEAPMKLYASVGNHALVIGSLGAAVLAATDRSLSLYQFPARARPVTAGAAGNQFMVALSNSLEEWDPQNRMPKRRLKLPRPAAITAVGGSDRVVWMTTQQEPARIDVIPLVNRGQPKAHDLPEPISSVASHPRSDLVVCVGATSGRVWVIDLDGRHGLRMIGPEGIDKVDAAGLVLGRVTGVVAAQAQRPVVLVGLDRNDDASGPVAVARESSGAAFVPRESSGAACVPRESSGAVVAPRTRASSSPVVAPKHEAMADIVAKSSLYGDEGVEAVPTSVTLPSSFADAGRSSFADAGRSPFADAGRSPFADAGRSPFADAGRSPFADADRSPFADADRSPFADVGPFVASEPDSFRGAQEPRSFATRPAPELAVKADPRLQAKTTRSTNDAVADAQRHFAAWRERMRSPRARTVETQTKMWPRAPATWRDDALAWARSVLAGDADAEVSSDSPFAMLVVRFDLSPALQPVLALLYGLHLAGISGASPAEVAKLLGSWDEALGGGELAERGVALYRESRVVLAPAVQRVLDELPPSTGTLVGIPSICSLIGPCTIVAHGPLAIVAEACSSSIGGAILAAHDGADP
ncbi:MAG: hypothetical protein HOV81_43475, partial [Kofleriaceae bacterium]|nr:hypothetical protein [Kofleriaceae bacterium]